MRVAIVGSRNYPNKLDVLDYVDALPNGTVVITGGATGVDSWAEEAARDNWLEVVVHLPDWKTHGKAAGPIRNRTIVQDAGRVVAFWDGLSRGTASTIQIARELGKPVEVIEPRERRGGGR